MEIILLLIGLVILCFLFYLPLSLIFGVGVIATRSSAKKQARQALERGRINDMRKFNRVSNILAHTLNDLEAADLWKRLRELKARQRA